MRRTSLVVLALTATVLAVTGLPAAAANRDTGAAAEYAKPGFRVALEDGRLWVFREGSQELQGFLEHGEPARQVVRPGGGPDGLTIKAVDGDVIDAYMAAGG
ncbi:MAG TPA: hypothetical protein VMS86_04385 [Thermoanaerobaculia bacterium]|nr:hypothetical protein [Thermoanaerobaculia bacterium]